MHKQAGRSQAGVFKTLLIMALGAAAGAAQAQPSAAELDRLASNYQPQVVEWRRHFHANPELSNREFETSAFIAEQLRRLGMEVETGIAHTGVVGLLKGGQPGPLVAVRADMDGLPVTEQTGLPFASTATAEFNGQEVGVMHACGHDTHMAMVLGVAEVLSAVKDDLPGSVLFIFQPAEEGAPDGEEGGAELMLKEGLFERYDPQAIFGLHIGLNMPGGLIAVRSGAAMAAVDEFRIKVQGQQTHGARPWGGIDPIVVGSQIVMGLQTIASRQLQITKAPYIITVGQFTAGIRNNIIPNEANMWGTIRSFDAPMQDDMHRRIRQTAEGIAASAGTTAEVMIRRQYPATVNDPTLTARMMPTLQRVTGDQVVTPELVTGAEDFSFFAQQIPGLFLFLGAAAPDAEAKELPGNHSPLFDVHEPNMELGVRALSQLVVDYLAAE
ncbi:MAG: M20 family metallopeptidase [Wenzhouxiangellaceae bacterium]